jgi:hypothetical protein
VNNNSRDFSVSEGPDTGKASKPGKGKTLWLELDLVAILTWVKQ